MYIKIIIHIFFILAGMEFNPQQFMMKVDYLLNQQSKLPRLLKQYNEEAEELAEKQEAFFNSLRDQDMIQELNLAREVFGKVTYIETDTPEVVNVEFSDEYNCVDIKNEYEIVDVEENVEETVEENVEETKTPLEEEPYETISVDDAYQYELQPETHKRILDNNKPQKERILSDIIKGKSEYVLFKSVENGLEMNEKLYTNIKDNNVVHPIKKFEKEVYLLLKQHCLLPETVKEVGMKPTCDDKKLQLVYSWA